ncbi:MAG TPA: hypothetical protein VNL77_21455 [Roseiflexaceae bacterium]|nr:hypothetical protein [Roseiflexaceae bacterium]
MAGSWRWRAAALFTLALVALVVGWPRGSRANGMTLAPALPRVEAGEVLEFHGAGFVPKERISVWATAPNQAVLGGGHFGASSRGNVRVQFTLPNDAMSGTWALTVWGWQSQTPVVTTFEVAGRPPEAAAPQVVVSPAAGPAGTTFYVSAIGFDKREDVSYWITGPDNRIYGAFPSGATAGHQGEVGVGWAPPPGAPPGVYVMTLQGTESGVARGVAFEVR